jgi:hypothetical protein
VVGDSLAANVGGAIMAGYDSLCVIRDIEANGLDI